MSNDTRPARQLRLLPTWSAPLSEISFLLRTQKRGAGYQGQRRIFKNIREKRFRYYNVSTLTSYKTFMFKEQGQFKNTVNLRLRRWSFVRRPRQPAMDRQPSSPSSFELQAKFHKQLPFHRHISTDHLEKQKVLLVLSKLWKLWNSKASNLDLNCVDIPKRIKKSRKHHNFEPHVQSCKIDELT